MNAVVQEGRDFDCGAGNCSAVAPEAFDYTRDDKAIAIEGQQAPQRTLEAAEDGSPAGEIGLARPLS